MRIFNNIFLIFLISVLSLNALSQRTDSVNKKRLYTAVAVETGAYGISMIGLYQLWYKDYPKSSFHWFDDSDEWLQMDKAGHFFTAYYFNQILSAGFRWSEMDRKRSVVRGSIMGFLFIGSLEVFDGFSEKWGASGSDLVANTAGILTYGIQEYVWEEQRIIPKFSFSASDYAKHRPDALGENYQERIIKDYNGQSHWLSFNINSFCETGLPDWLNIAFGYGGDGMVSGKEYVNAEVYSGPYFERYRQYYLSLDVDLSRIETNSKLLRSLFQIFNFIKIPLPTLELSQGKLKGHIVHF